MGLDRVSLKEKKKSCPCVLDKVGEKSCQRAEHSLALNLIAGIVGLKVERKPACPDTRPEITNIQEVKGL